MRVIFILFITLNLYSNEILGEIDKFNLPSLNLTNIEARIDTGATSSSIHCIQIKKIDNHIKCKLLNKTEIIKPISKIAEVKSSNGEKATRYFIKSDIEIFNKIYEIELSLNDRTNMQYPLLIGRELLKKGFVVDVQKQNLSYKSSNYKEQFPLILVAIKPFHQIDEHSFYNLVQLENFLWFLFYLRVHKLIQKFGLLM